jgi:hypothetical protein
VSLCCTKGTIYWFWVSGFKPANCSLCSTNSRFGPKLLFSTQTILGLFLGVLALVFLGDQATSTLDQWFGVGWQFVGVTTRVMVVMEGA